VLYCAFASLEVYSSIGTEAFLEEDVAVHSVVRLNKRWVVLVDVLLGGDERQFRYL
jgi:hypothetical protein